MPHCTLLLEHAAALTASLLTLHHHPLHLPPGQDDTTPVKERLHQVFSSYATFGTGQAGSSAGSGLAKAPELDSSRFAKLVREAGLLDKAFDLTSADLVFAKVRGVEAGGSTLWSCCNVGL